jgi:sarcosine oxidase/L-pipecolate oxidase
MDAHKCLSTSPPGLPRGRHYDAVVVGGGVMGVCAAFHLAQRGKAVLLLEQFEFLHRRGSSHGESRIIRRTYPEACYTEMMSHAYPLWEQAQQAGPHSHC